MATDETGWDRLNNILTHADKTYSKLPDRIRLQVDDISQGLAQFAHRKLRRKGQGTEFFSYREYRPGDERRMIDHRASARSPHPIVQEKEAEIRQHFYLWRKGHGTMDFSSSKNVPTKKEAAEIMMLAFAKHLARNEELIGVLDKQGTYSGGRAPNNVAFHLQDVNILTGDLPTLNRKLPVNSTVVLFSDFFTTADEIERTLDDLSNQGLRGFLVMTLDPQDLLFDKYKGHVNFQGLQGEAARKFGKAEDLASEFHKKMNLFIQWTEKLALSKGYDFIIQRTDKPLYEALYQIYGIKPPGQSNQNTPSPSN